MKINRLSVKETVNIARDYFRGFFESQKENPWGDVDMILTPKPDSAILFTVKGEPVIKLSEEGFFYKGRLVEKDKEVYKAVKDFFVKTIGDNE